MYHDPENFDSLRRLLALKRHEQPPPGYFHYFSRQVISRIQAGERAEDAGWLSRWFGQAQWLQDFWAALQTKPVVAGSVGLAACGLLLAGVIYTEGEAPEPSNSPAIRARLDGGESATLAAFQQTNAFSGAPSQSSLFGVSVQPVNFVIPRN